jgi:hypothetical protein
MPIRVLPVRLSSVLLTAVALAVVAGPWVGHDDEYESPSGSRVCLGSVGIVFCVPPDQMPPSPPSAPGLPSPPSR